MLPLNNISNKLFQVSYPKYSLLQFLKYCDEMGAKITQNKTLADFSIAFNSIIVNKTTNEFIPASQQQFPESEHFLITAIRGLSGANVTLAATAWVAGWSDALSINGTYTINNAGSIVQLNQPFTNFQPGSNSPDAGWVYLSTPILWQGQTSLKFTGAWDTAPSTANQNGRIELHGLKLI